jgi:hypothetical protein
MFFGTSVRLHASGITRRAYATVSQGFRIPVIDFSKFRAAQTTEEKKETAKEIVSAFKTSGFMYVKNHGIPGGECRLINISSITMPTDTYRNY